VTDVDIVVPTVGRPSLQTLLRALDRECFPGRIFVVDDRREHHVPLLAAGVPADLDVVELRGGARGPAAARNAGWRASSARWIVFLDDDVEVTLGWFDALRADLRLAADVAGSKGRVVVPLPPGRAPTDWERNVAGLESAPWVTADMAYRREVLRALNGFDEGFPRAYREDSDLAVRVLAAGWRLAVGTRHVTHPVRPAPWHVSIGKQAGNADDARMRRLHGRDWQTIAGATPGVFRRHVATTALGLTAGGAWLGGRPLAASVLAAGWLGATASFAWTRIAGGPKTGAEIAAMVATSTVIPPGAVWHRLSGMAHARNVRRARPSPPLAVLFDRDGTLIADVPYNSLPERVVPLPGAKDALQRLRAADVRIGLVTNQSGIDRGLLTRTDADRVNERTAALLGGIDVVELCEHGPGQRCLCRKPGPGLIHRAAAALGVPVESCAVVGDAGTDVAAALAAGARGVLVPGPGTSRHDIGTAPVVAADLQTAVDILLGAP
jgi:histidinol-phosphate phosphatase family protein